jgi:hypothetical protein
LYQCATTWFDVVRSNLQIVTLFLITSTSIKPRSTSTRFDLRRQISGWDSRFDSATYLIPTLSALLPLKLTLPYSEPPQHPPHRPTCRTTLEPGFLISPIDGLQPTTASDTTMNGRLGQTQSRPQCTRVRLALRGLLSNFIFFE